MEQNHHHSLVFYRTYRPRRFSEFIDQEVARKTLQNAILQNRISHGYLFAGMRGTGKTTLARLFAKTINCLKPNKTKTDIEPCNECDICRDMNEGRSMDLVEIDAASNRGIDEIRELREGVRFSPIKALYRVFIIDEVHMLTTFAFNALLKTLEEPPEHALFILATTDPEKIPATILSRVQRFDFKKVPAYLIVKKLSQIRDAEHLRIDDEALRLMAYYSEGSIRDAESLLSQVTAFAPDEDMTASTVEQVIGVVTFDRLQEFLQALARSDAATAIRFINRLQDEEYQLYQVMKLAIDLLQRTLVLKLDASYAQTLQRELPTEQVDALATLAATFDGAKLQAFTRGFLSNLYQIKKSVLPTLPIELVIAEVLGTASPTAKPSGRSV